MEFGQLDKLIDFISFQKLMYGFGRKMEMLGRTVLTFNCYERFLRTEGTFNPSDNSCSN